MNTVKITALAALGMLIAGAAGAQTGLSSDDILNRLSAQAKAEQDRNAGAVGGDTRGIKISAGQSGASGTATSVAAAPERTEPATGTVRPASVRPGEPPVVPDADRIDLRITFETNSAFIRPGSAALLGNLCTALQKAPSSWSFNIIGHADASGGAEYNRRLSSARAREVARYLERECGVASNRLVTYGLGSSRLLDGVPPVSETNRRVEVSINQI
jgi:outer membrane protein OmpA-like peptidoglycan-associated protein